jgi:hypothetical protein
MKTLLSVALAAAIALSVVSVLPSAKADPVSCLDNSGIPGVPVFGMELDRCYDVVVCQDGSTTTVGLRQRTNPPNSNCLPLVKAAPLDCAIVDGYQVTVVLDGPTNTFPVERSLNVCLNAANPPPSPVGPCGPTGKGTGVFLNGDQVVCVGPAPGVPSVAPCYERSTLMDTWAGISVEGVCLAVGLCQGQNSPGVAQYRNGVLVQCITAW